MSTGGRPIYYVSSRRDVFTPMKLPKYTLPKVAAHSHLLDTKSESAMLWQSKQTLLFQTQIIVSLDVSLWSFKPLQNQIFFSPASGRLLLLSEWIRGRRCYCGPLPLRMLCYYSKLKICCAHMTIKHVLFNQALGAPLSTHPATLARSGVDEIRKLPACGFVAFAQLTHSI